MSILVCQFSESILDKVRVYIKNQEKHHKHETFRMNMTSSLKNMDLKNLAKD